MKNISYLVVTFAVIIFAPLAQAQGGWVYDSGADPMTDVVTEFAFIVNDEGASAGFHCTGSEPGFIFVAGDFEWIGDNSNLNLQYRFDANEVNTVRAFSSDDLASVDATQDTFALHTAANASEQLTLRMTAFDGEVITHTFDISEAVPSLKCFEANADSQ